MPEPLSDYACQNELFYYNFNGIDPDGDSLVYDLVSPLNGYSVPTDNVPFANPAPYPEISWLAGYNKENQVPGSPALNIDRKTGRLTVRPTNKGLFVFGIRSQEFRNGVKIGETRRDIQLMVKECLRNETPVVLAKGSNSTGLYNPGQVYRINKTGPRCLDILFTDPDKNERLVLSAKPVNFSNKHYSFSGQTQGIVNTGTTQDTLKATLCFTDCFDTAGKTYLLDLIVSDYGDNGCGLPRQDTLRLSLVAERASDRPPVLSFSTPIKVIEAFEGETIRFEVIGTDPDNDLVTVAGAGQGFTFNSQSIVFKEKKGTGRTSAEFSWLIDCQALQQPSYKIEFIAASGPCEKVTTSEIIEIRPKRRSITHNAIASEQLICYNSIPAILTGSPPAGGTEHYTYLWEASTTGAQTGFSPAAGNNNQPHYTPAALPQTTWYRRKVMAGDCNEHTSSAIAIKVEPLPAAPQATPAITCPGGTVVLKAAAPAAGSELEWYDQPTGGMLLHRGSSYETPPLDASTDFYVQTVNRHGCVSASRTKASATVLPSTADAGEDIAIIQGRRVGLKAKGG
ncbi:immunoglobulin domain-containing protein, partial [Pontibacter sp. HJ8]